ncbi:hypothetical protein BDV19DRAFT_388053 [Aspergillus venezuelensis]
MAAESLKQQDIQQEQHFYSSMMIITPVLYSALLALPLSQSALAAPLESNLEARQDGDVEAQWTWLHFEGCTDDQKTAIRRAHGNALDMADHVKSIDFANDNGAMDFFGPSALNKDWQGNVLDVFHHISTFRQSSLPGFRMNARCGRELDKKYQNKCGKAGLIAYQWNTKKGKNGNDGPIWDKEDGVSNMHFCDQFFLYGTLSDTVKDAMDTDDFKYRYHLGRYKNQAYIMLHEMMHATVMTYKENRNRRIVDMAMEVYEYSERPDNRDYRRRKVRRDVYGPENCKILARTQHESVIKEGITMNADTYAQFALAKWVQSQLPGNQYPWLPLADTQALDWYSRGGAMIVLADNETFSLNTAALSNDVLTTSDSDGNDDAYTLHDVDDEEVATIDLTEATLVSATDFSSDFNNEIFQWSSYVRTPEPECAKTGSDAPSDRVSFNVDEAEEQIKEFCSNKDNYGTLLTTFINQGTGETRDGARKAMGLDSGVTVGNGVLWIGAYYGGGSWNGNQTWPQTGPGLLDTDLCLDRFRTILNGCDTDTRDNKYGGSLTDFGLVYQVIAVGSVDDAKPLGTVPLGENGGVECKDTDDAVYDWIDQPTCTCWFRDLPEQTSVFGTPKEGTCADIDYRPAWTYFEDPEYRPVKEEGEERPVVY